MHKMKIPQILTLILKEKTAFEVIHLLFFIE